MNNTSLFVVQLHWAAVIIYSITIILNMVGIIFEIKKAEKISYLAALGGIVIHGASLAYWWHLTGHGPYVVKFEVLSSVSWTAMVLFFLFVRVFPAIKPFSFFIFPFAYLLVGLALFCNPEIKSIPPTYNTIWLVLHVMFYKISLGTLLMALAFSISFILKSKTSFAWLNKLPKTIIIDIYAYRFAGFGFTFWGMATVSGAIWAYQSWGRFWGWDPIETWALITWIFFGIYLHLRRFFGWTGEKAAYFFIVCFSLSIFSLFFVPLLEATLHSEYFQ